MVDFITLFSGATLPSGAFCQCLEKIALETVNVRAMLSCT